MGGEIIALMHTKTKIQVNIQNLFVQKLVPFQLFLEILQFMNPLQHIAIYLPADILKPALIQQIIENRLLPQVVDLQGLKPAVFSDLALEQFLEEEFLHGRTGFDTGYNRPLHAMSSGEQKKALLNQLLSKNPDYFLLDAVFDHLDIGSQAGLLKNLQSIAATKPIIQLFHRKKELLPFINHYFSFFHESLVEYPTAEDLFNELGHQSAEAAPQKLPQPLHPYPPPSGPLVMMNALAVSYDGRPILRSINWQINPGEFWQLVGPNGSGKSTLLSLITGDNPKGYGQELFLFGRKKGSGETVWDIKQNIGYFNDSLTLHFSRLDSIEKMIVSGFFDSVGLYIKPSDQQLRLAHEWLHFIGLYALRHKPIQFLPLARQRMVLIARAMVKHPPLLILDEPTAGLDDMAAALIIRMIQQIAAESHSAILYVSHSKEEGLEPDHIFELQPGESGSRGVVIHHSKLPKI